jgi:hypothetical protein
MSYGSNNARIAAGLMLATALGSLRCGGIEIDVTPPAYACDGCAPACDLPAACAEAKLMCGVCATEPMEDPCPSGTHAVLCAKYAGRADCIQVAIPLCSDGREMAAACCSDNGADLDCQSGSCLPREECLGVTCASGSCVITAKPNGHGCANGACLNGFCGPI